MKPRKPQTPADTAADISFDAGYYDSILIRRIARRWKAMSDDRRDIMEINMDVTATHCNGNPLRLQDMIDADNFNFAHDMHGIYRHLNRKTGKLENCFLPRFTMQQRAVA